MLVIRYQRVGRRNDASFRIIATEHTSGPKSGKNVELLGSYNPKTKATILKKDRIEHWISMGAQVSDSVHNLLIKEGVIEGKKINVLPKKSPIVKEVEETEEAPAEEVADDAAPADDEAPVEEKKEEEAPKEEVVEEKKEEEKVEEAPAEEEKKEESVE